MYIYMYVYIYIYISHIHVIHTSMPNLVFLTYSSLQIFVKNLDGGISNFRISCQFLIKLNCHNS